ncbi:MAG: dockerin type I repeat-containing protein, partial [Oscillospiraceae bacterium]|nr:dockerin type I repeat-containing protein [Oscillospiraceae bacterium]
YSITFPETLNGNKIVLDIALDGTQSASGCVDFSVKYQGDDYWAHCNWAATTSGKVELDLMNLTGAMNITAGDEKDNTDEVLLAALAEEIKKMKTVSFQTWYVADENWDDSDHSKVTLKSATLLKESSGESGDTPVTTPPAVTTPAPETTEPSETLELIIGDVDGNGRVDVTDLTFLSLNLIGEHELSGDNEKAADVDMDGKITLADLARMRQFLSRIVDKF